MHNKYIYMAALLILVSCSNQIDNFEYPESNKVPFSEEVHGYVIEDAYRWMEDFTSEDSTDWVERQNNPPSIYKHLRLRIHELLH